MPIKTKSTTTAGKGENLASWLTLPESQIYFGAAWALKADVLAAVITGKSLAAVAMEHGVTNEAAYKYARRARTLFPTYATKS